MNDCEDSETNNIDDNFRRLERACNSQLIIKKL